MKDVDDYEEISGVKWQGKPEYSEENLPHCRCVQHRSHMA
jgi:hypothetical protein